MKAPILLLSISLLLVACKEQESQEELPKTAEEMYHKAEALLKPNVEGAASDLEGALKWTRRAAEAGYIKAQTDLAGLYLEGGKGIEKNIQEAYKWFKKAAEQGNVQSRFFIGNILYRGGEGIAQDTKAAIEQWAMAAKAGLPEAQASLGHFYVQSEEHFMEGIDYLTKAAQMGIAQAALDLGFIYAKGKYGIEQDMNEAIEWYKRAADAGNPKALVILALMNYNGEHMVQNQQQALVLFRLAAGQDYIPAMRLLASALKQQDDESLIEEAHAWEKRIEELEKTPPTPAASSESSASIK